MKHKKLIFSVLFTGILFLNTFLFTNINENKLQLNSLFTLATAQTENVENGEYQVGGDRYYCIQQFTRCHLNLACPSGYGTYGYFEERYWCSSGNYGECEDSYYKQWWDCNGQTGLTNYGGKKNCR